MVPLPLSLLLFMSGPSTVTPTHSLLLSLVLAASAGPAFSFFLAAIYARFFRNASAACVAAPQRNHNIQGCSGVSTLDVVPTFTSTTARRASVGSARI